MSYWILFVAIFCYLASTLITSPVLSVPNFVAFNLVVVSFGKLGFWCGLRGSEVLT